MTWINRLWCRVFGHRLNYFAWRFENDTVCWRCGYETRQFQGGKVAESSQVQFYLTPDGEHKIASVWVEGGKLMIRMGVDNVFDVIFESSNVLRPRNIQFKNRE